MNSTATGDLVFIQVDGTYLYRMVDAIKINHLGQLCYRFGCQWYNIDFDSVGKVRVGQLRRCEFWLPGLNAFVYHVVKVAVIKPTYNHQIALIEVEHWSEVEQCWISLGKVQYHALKETVGTAHTTEDQALVLQPNSNH